MSGDASPLIAPRYLIASLVAHALVAATPLARPPAASTVEGPLPLQVTMRRAVVATPPSAPPRAAPSPTLSASLPASEPRLPPRPTEAAPPPPPAPTVEEPPSAAEAVVPPADADHGLAPLPPLARLATEVERSSPRSGPSDTHLLSLYTQELVARVNRERKYPKLARIRGWQGTTVVDVRIGADGEVLSLKVASSSGHELLDDQALRMIREASPLPAPSTAEAALPLLVQVPITFSLR